MDREKKVLRISLCFVIAAAVILADQLTKVLAVYKLKGNGSKPIIENVLHLTYVQNEGAAFGMLKNSRWIFMIITTVVVIGLIYFVVRRNSLVSGWMNIALAFVIGGGIGNMIDRVAFGYVVDFIDFTLIDFPVFNTADSFVTVGVFILAFDILFGKSKTLLFADNKDKAKSEETEIQDENNSDSE